MQLVVADTGPINYLILIESIDVLPVLFNQVILPESVELELRDPGAPTPVKTWIDNPPNWLDVRKIGDSLREPMLPAGLDEGEAGAIRLAVALHADLLLIDDRKGVAAAIRLGLSVTGTLGILDLAAERGLLNFPKSVERLRQTNFRVPELILTALVKKHTGESC